MDEEEFILKMCESKIYYRKKKTAVLALRSIKRTGKILLTNFKPYKCFYCRGWHIGHSK